MAALKAEIPPGDHIEVFLTHLGDYISLSERSRGNTTNLGGEKVSKQKLTKIHLALLRIISNVVRWGYIPPGKDANGDPTDAVSGKPGASIVEIGGHQDFVEAIFSSRRAGLESVRGRVEFFTTNYDTLIEDALALQQIEYHDGFDGGAVAFWNPKNWDATGRCRAHVTKLHGSVDWYRSSNAPSPLLRVRFGDAYPPDGGAVMIYPQATKYQNSQENPFSELFGRFRNRLADGKDHVLITCGYSFGDEHINADIEIAMSAPRSQLVLLAFSREDETGLPSALERWRSHASWNDRVYVASQNGLYRGSSDVYFEPEDGERDWWTFEGVTKLLALGLPSDIQAALA